MTIIRHETSADVEAIRQVVRAAFDDDVEAGLVDRLRDNGEMVLSIVAVEESTIVGHAGFSRLWIDDGPRPFAAVALAPVAVVPARQGAGIGGLLIGFGHQWLMANGECLSVVVGDPAYYHRFGYRRDLAEGFTSAYQSDALMAIAFGEAPLRGVLRYARAFDGL